MAGGHDGGRSRGAGLDVLRRTCPSRSVLARVVGKWTVLVVVALQAWAQAHAQEVIRARERYDAAGPPVSAGSPETARGRASSEQN